MNARSRDSLLSAFDGMVGLENQIKRHRMAMFLDIRKVLSVDQRKTLQQIMTETLSRTERHGPGGEGGRDKEVP